MKESKRCTCGLDNDIFCPNCSMLKMTILLKNGNDHLKWRASNGKLYCPSWYSKLKYNRMDAYRVAEKMEESLRKSDKYAGTAQVLMFYVNGRRHHHIKRVDL